jgi:hypothetical protein
MTDNPSKNGTAQVVDSKPEPTVTWPVKDGEALVGTVRLASGRYQCVLPDGSVVETFTIYKLAMEFLHRRGQMIPLEERAASLKADVDQLAHQSQTEWRLGLPDYAKWHGLSEAKLQEMIEAEIEANEKRACEQKLEDERREQRAEKQAEKKASQEKAKAKEEREEIERQDRRARRDARDQLAAESRARQRQREIDRQLAIILKQPIAEHDSRLMEAATRLGEDINNLRAQFAELLDIERERRGIGDVEPWSEPVNINTLLNDIHKHRGGYVIIHI